MKVNNVPRDSLINGFVITPSWEYFFSNISDALKGSYEYTKRNPTASGVTPTDVIVNRNGHLIHFLITWTSDVTLSGTLVFPNKSLSMHGGKLMIIDGDVLQTVTASCINDTITLPSYTSSNGSVTIQGTILTKETLKEVN